MVLILKGERGFFISFESIDGLGVRLSKVLADGDSGASDWRKPELVVESAA
jgi:hypothetical protein